MLLPDEGSLLFVGPRHQRQFLGPAGCIDREEQLFVGRSGGTQANLPEGHLAPSPSNDSLHDQHQRRQGRPRRVVGCGQRAGTGEHPLL